MKTNQINSENERYYVKKMVNDIQNEIQVRSEGLKVFMDNSLDVKDQFSIEDYGTVVDDRRTVKRRLERINTLKSSLNSPYFGRMDIVLVDGKNEKRFFESDNSIFIGYEELSANRPGSGKRTLVYSWKSDWGELFNRSSESLNQKLKVRKYVGCSESYLTTCEAVSKIGVNIEKRKYRSHQVKYLQNSGELEQTEIQDPFLQLVLKERLNHNQPVDIVRSIQHKQNEIIWTSPDRNILVEGCAGSGKTMVLLHRLSVWDYRRQILGNSCYFIVPENDLKESLSDLVEQLELNKLNVLTIPEFYKVLIENTCSEHLHYRIAKSDSAIQPWVLNEIYSSLDNDKIRELVISETMDQFDYLYQKTTADYLKKFGISLPEIGSENIHKSVQKIDQILRKLNNERFVLKNDLDNTRSIIDHTARQLDSLENSSDYQFLIREKRNRTLFLKNYIQTELNYLKYLKKKLELPDGRREIYKHNYAAGLQSDLIRVRSSYLKEVPSKYPHLISLPKKKEEIQKLLSKRNELDFLIRLYEDGNLNSFPFDRFRTHKAVHKVTYSQYKRFLDKGTSRLFKLIRKLILKSDYIGKLNQALSIHLKAAPNLHSKKEKSLYQRKSKIYKKEMLNKIDLAIREEKMIEEEINRFCSQKFTTIIESYNRLQQYDETIYRLKKEELVTRLFDPSLFSDPLSEQEHTDLLLILPDMIDFLEVTALDDPESSITDDIDTHIFFLEPFIQLLRDLLPKFDSESERIKNKILANQEDLAGYKVKETQIASKIRYYRSEESEKIKTGISEMRKNLSVQNLIKAVFKRLYPDIYKGISDKNVLYPCELFLGLRIAMIYHPDFERIEAGLICIDEVQDYSIKELEVLKSVFITSSKWNLFGDLMQSTYSYKKIEEWAEIHQLLKCKKFILNENYRNPVTITDYCNLHLDLNMNPLGLPGNPVQILSEDEFRTILIDCTLASDEKPVSIFSSEKILREFSNRFRQYNLKTYLVNEVKGQEFKNVVVIDKDMTRKEKYLAYSRALENLYLVSL